MSEEMKAARARLREAIDERLGMTNGDAAHVGVLIADLRLLMQALPASCSPDKAADALETMMREREAMIEAGMRADFDWSQGGWSHCSRVEAIYTAMRQAALSAIGE